MFLGNVSVACGSATPFGDPDVEADPADQGFLDNLREFLDKQTAAYPGHADSNAEGD